MAMRVGIWSGDSLTRQTQIYYETMAQGLMSSA